MVEILQADGPDELTEAQRIARRSFPALVAPLISRPKWAYLAVVDDKPLAGIILKSVQGRDGITIGIVEWIFVLPEARGQGLASRLVERGLAAFGERGIEHMTAWIRDDNTPSWNLFARRGFRLTPFRKGVVPLGFQGSLRSLGGAMFSRGLDTWMRTPQTPLSQPSKSQQHRSGSLVGNLLFALGIPAIAVMAGALLQGLGVWYALAVTALVSGVIILRLLVGRMAAGDMRGADHNPGVALHSVRGGFLVTLIVGLSGILLPVPHYWQPKARVWREQDYRSPLGRSNLGTLLATAAGSWGLLLLTATVPALRGAATHAAVITAGMLAVDAQPWNTAWAGPRVLRWSPLAWGIAALVAAASIVLVSPIGLLWP